MNVAICNRFGVLLAEKRMSEKRNIPLSEVAEATGLPPKTLFAWQNNTVTRFGVHVINAICKYFEVQPRDLFGYVPDEGDQSQPKQKAPASRAVSFVLMDPQCILCWLSISTHGPEKGG